MSLVSLRTNRSITTLRLERPLALNAMSEAMAEQVGLTVLAAAFRLDQNSASLLGNA